jgi:murein DD-endopeptidase MepM/ murein hydrolase activator NlpD
MRQNLKQPLAALLIIAFGFGIHLTQQSSARASNGPAAALSIFGTSPLDSLRNESAELKNTIVRLARVDLSLRETIPATGTSREVDALSERIDSIRRSVRSEQPTGDLRTEIAAQHGTADLLAQLVREHETAIAAIPDLTPTVGILSSNFGERIHPITGRLMMHTGIDLAAPKGTAITAAAAGTVIYAGPMGGYGNAVKIDHGHGYATLYGHSSKILVKVGDKVERGDEIALVGSTGMSTGPHLHYEVFVDSTRIDPIAFLMQPPIMIASTQEGTGQASKKSTRSARRAPSAAVAFASGIFGGDSVM